MSMDAKILNKTQQYKIKECCLPSVSLGSASNYGLKIFRGIFSRKFQKAKLESVHSNNCLHNLYIVLGFRNGSRVKNSPAIQETLVWSLGGEDPLEEEMATHSCILAWRIPWTEEPGGLHTVHRVTDRQTWWYYEQSRGDLKDTEGYMWILCHRIKDKRYVCLCHQRQKKHLTRSCTLLC